MPVRIIYFASFLIAFLIIFSPNVFAQFKSTSVITRVGEAPMDKKPSLGGGGVTDGDFTFYCQNDPSWANTCSLAFAGCGPTSMAMILSSFGGDCGGQKCTPPIVDSMFRTTGARAACSDGSSIPNFTGSKVFKDMGFIVADDDVTSGGSIDLNLAKKYINEGYLILSSSRRAPSCGCDHIFVIQDVFPESSQILVRDPNCKLGEDGKRIEKYTYPVGIMVYLYAIPIKKVR